MPIYEYRCADNGTTLEVSHAMSDSIATWSELCERTGHALGTTDPNAPVEKVVSMPIAHTSDSPKGGANGGPKGPPTGGCGPSCGCVGH